MRRRGTSLARLEGMASAAARPPRVDDDLGLVLNCQWPGPSEAQRMGWPALARAVLAEACLDAGVVRRRGPVRDRERWSAARYLLEADADVALPLALACALIDVDPVRVRATVRLRLP